jgi:hypothetical protein
MGDRLCSVFCDAKGPSLTFTRQGVKHRVYGCPVAHVPQTVKIFMRDYDRIRDGIVTPYRMEELPSKFDAFISLYTDWSSYFERTKEKMDETNVPDTMKQIQEYRARGGSR